MRIRVLACLMAFGLLSGACSSTSKRADTSGALSLNQTEGAGSQAAADAPGGVDNAVPGSQPTGGSARGPAAAGSSSGSASGPIRAPSVAGGAKGTSGAQTTSLQPIKVGAYGLSAGNASIATGASIGDPVKMSTAVANWVNAHGGAGGRPIQLVQAVTDASSSTPVEQQDQAACAKFTEDAHVEAVVSIVVTTPTFYDCLAKKNVPYIANTITGPDSTYYNSRPVFSTSPSRDRVAVNQVEALSQIGYFKDAGAKLAIVYSDHPWWKSAADAFKRQAAKHSVGVTQEAAICKDCSAQEQTTESQNAVVKFRGAGINHVAFVMDAIPAITFITAAESSGFYPRYGMESQDLPAVAALAITPESLRNSVGMGYTPATDVEAAQDVAETAPMKLCTQIMAASGQTASNRLHLEVQRYTCDGYFFLKFLLDRTGGKADLRSLYAAVEATGAAYPPVMTWTDYFGPNRRDGTQSWRPFAYDVTCKCYRYTGAEQQMIPLPGQSR